MKKRLVISAINFSEGGPLTILHEAVESAVASLAPDWEIIALVHRRDLIELANVTIIEFPHSKKSWFLRIYYEWYYFKHLSKDLLPDLWLSLHDITPRVIAKRQAVYCHNPSPFYRLSWREARLEPTFALFNLFYRFLYGCFIQRNQFVVVQQDWLRGAFKKLFGSLNVVVAHPSVNVVIEVPLVVPASKRAIFFYPALSRVFKNFELICEAVKLLNSRGYSDFDVKLTISGNENAYARWLYACYSNLSSVQFVGRLSKAQMAQQYQSASVVLFPSKLETWGLPITEAKFYGKNLLVSDLPYAHETVGDYARVSFFESSDAHGLADLMQAIIENRWQPSGSVGKQPDAPFAPDWPSLWATLTKDL